MRHQPDRMFHNRRNQRNGADARRSSPIRPMKYLRQHRRQPRHLHMGIEIDDGIAFQLRLDLRARLAERAFDDAAVLHVGRQQRHGMPRRLRPFDALAARQRMVIAHKQAVALQ